MGTTYSRLDEKLVAFIKAQRMFFVATAPLSADGSVNISPKGYDSFVVFGVFNLKPFSASSSHAVRTVGIFSDNAFKIMLDGILKKGIATFFNMLGEMHCLQVLLVKQHL